LPLVSFITSQMIMKPPMFPFNKLLGLGVSFFSYLLSMLYVCYFSITSAKTNNDKKLNTALSIFIVILFLLPIYSGHHGWGWHKHFIWESAAHVH